MSRHKLLLPIMLIIFGVSASSKAEVVGLSSGEFRVDESGAATYSVPINIPEGRAGVTPQVSLNYSSNNLQDGPVGIGWSVGGISAVSRCPQTPINDNAITGVNFTSSDRFCLDGQRLILLAGTYGAPYSTYIKEIDDFSIVTAMGGSQANGPSYFEVKTKAGETYYYGNPGLTGLVSTNQADAFVEPSNKTGMAKTWAVKVIKDIKDNYILFNYNNSKANGTFYIDSIQYSAKLGDSTAFNKVKFVYEDYGKGFLGYQAGAIAKHNKILKRIDSSVDGSNYRSYFLNYENSNFIEERTLLTSVQECPDNDTDFGNCLPKTTFGWQRPNLSSSSMQYLCKSEPAGPDFCHDVPTSTDFKPFENPTSVASGSANVSTSQVFDVNGDGYQDIVYVSGSSWAVKLGPYFTSTKTMTSIGTSKKEYALNIDYNGDGVRDLLVANSATANWHALSFQASESVEACAKWEQCVTKIITSEYTLTNLNVVATGLENGAQVMDVNGDGNEDIVFRTGNTIKAHVNNGNGTFTANKPLYTFTDTVASVELNMGVQSQTADMKSASAVDVNGDGRSDLVMKVTSTTSGCYVRGVLNASIRTRDECQRDWAGTWTSSTSTKHMLFVASGTMANPVLTLQQTLGNYEDTFRIADLNGDGLSDLLFVSGDKWWYRLSNGIEFLASRDAGLATSSTKKYLDQFVDLNNDGRADVLHATSTSNWAIFFSRPTNSGEWISFESRGFMDFDANATVRFGDTDGDGKLNLLTSTGSSWKKYYNRKGIKEFAINTITNGFGVATTVTYKPMTDSSVYVTNFSDADTTTDTFSPHSGMQLVSKVETQSNIGVDGKVSVNYQYGGFLIHKKGRGLLGFQMLKTIDNQTNVVTETKYSQEHGELTFAHAGMPIETIQMLDTQMLSRASNTLDVIQTANGGISPYIASSEEESYILDSNLSSTLSSVTLTTNQYDDWGNLLESNIEISDEYSNDVLTTNNVNTYGSGDWERYGRLASSVVTKTRTGDPKTHVRETTFDYYSNLMLKSSTLSPNQAATKLTTTYGYDVWGNKTSEAVTGYSTATGTNITRSTSSNYGAKGRYLSYTDDAMGFRTSFKYNNVDADSVTGVITSIKTTDANNVAKIEYFDDLGRLKTIDHPDAKTTTVTQAFCSSCSSNAYYYVRTTVTGNPTQEVYFDKWGREVIAQTTSFSGGWNKVIKEYDEQGREKMVYEPNSTGFTLFEYDELNRPNTVTKPNGKTVTNELFGFESRTTNEVGITTSVYQNGFGETAYTEDAIGNTVSFTYDAQGNVVTTDTTGEGSNYIVTVTYDDWGRKLSTNDPSKGLWKYTYNAFGELMTQETARGHTFTFSYDLLGRKIKSYEPSEGTLCWNYGTATDKGRLLSVEKFDAAVATCATGNPTYKNSFTYYPDGLVKTTTTLIDGNTFTQSQTYDSYSRPSITTYPTGTAAFSVKNHYSTTTGYLTEVRNNVTGALLKRVDSMTARNQVDEVTYGNNVTTTAMFEDDTGWLSSIDVKKGSAQLAYTDVVHDDIGNVTSRWTKFGSIPGGITDFTETYGYDYLTNRLEDRTISIATGSAILPANFKTYQDYNYDDWGNIKFKTGVGNYTYYATKPHQLNEVKSASGAQLYKFFYDANGNSETDGTRTFTYGSYDKPTLITKAGSSSTMKYGPERELIFKTDTYVENGKNVTYQTTYLGNYEKVYRTGGAGPLTEHKFYVGDIVYTQRSNGSSDTFYLHKDHQGSVIATTNASGAVVSQAIYDPWGKRTAVYLASLLSNYTYSEPTDRGYTGHKHIKDLDIIHMGGRIYDSTLGRFLQADPFVQAPTDSQSYNRYAYVRNNPMSMTDPSGYFFKKLLRSIAKVPILNMAVHVVLNLIPGCQGWCSAVYAAASAYAVTGSLKAAFTSGIVSAITPGAEGFLAAGVIGGLASKAQGGNFGHGFWSAGLGAAVGGRIKTGNAYANVIVSAVIGGSVSKVTGGKFANGAQTWAFSAALRAAMNGEFEAKGREATNQQELTKDQIAVSKANFLKAKSAVLKDYTNGYFGSAVDGEVMHVDAADVSFEEGRLYHEGKEVWGLTTPKNHRSSWSASIEISAAACLDSANCYQTLGHEFAHTNMYSYFNLKNGHSEMALMAQGMGSPERFMMAISAGRKTYLEDFAEYTGVTWAKSKGY
ncbi:FG-GAP-like repeat-containing protein [Shewanella sp. AC91-MNA-CIBAN-0169]|uniref:FG-GAP-like repeat-containing protein n=1 Tax=Shewanella sp. AC91-MNA-CIBAN-0169 TaxID=3140466 RepID=UPI00331D0472